MHTSRALAFALSALAILATGAAHAQSAVTVYGIVDTGVEYLSHVNAAGNSQVRMPGLAGGMFPSRLGLRGSEDLGGGLNAIFTLENGFVPDSGTINQGSRLFGRQAWAGLSGKWGALTAGRTYSMLYLSTFDVDPFGPSTYGLAALDMFIPNARHDNSLSYKGSFHGVTVGATYSLGRDASAAVGPSGTNCPGELATDKQACREWWAMLRYDGASWGVLAAYDRLNGGPGAAAGLSNSGLSDARLDYRNSGNDSTQFLLRSMLDLSRRTTVYLAAGHIRNGGSATVSLSSGGTVGAGMSQNGVIAGIKHTF